MSEFFKNPRAHGVVGPAVTILLIIVFGGLFLVVFDGRFNGEHASQLRDRVHEQQNEIYAIEGKIDSAESKLVEQERFEIILGELDKTEKELEVLTEKEGSLTAEIEEEKTRIEKIGEEKIAYREEYRVFARKDAIGEVFDELTLASGKVLKNAKIREIFPDKIRFSTEYGTMSVAWEDFEDDMRDRFQIGEGELEEHQAKMKAIAAKRNQLAAEGRSERAVYLREMELRKSLSRIERSLAEKTVKLDRAMIQERELRAKAELFRSKAASSPSTLEYSDYSGYSTYTQSAQQRAHLNTARRAEGEASALSSRISIAKNQISNLKRDKRKVEQDLEKVKKRR